MTVVRSCFLICFLAILPDSRSRHRTVVTLIFIPYRWNSLFRSTALMRRFILLLCTRSWSSLRVVFLFRLHFPFRLIFTAPVIFRLLKSLMIRLYPSVRLAVHPRYNSRTTTDSDKWTTDIDSACFEYVHKRVSSFCDFSVNSSKNHCIYRSTFAWSASISIFVF